MCGFLQRGNVLAAQLHLRVNLVFDDCCQLSRERILKQAELRGVEPRSTAFNRPSSAVRKFGRPHTRWSRQAKNVITSWLDEHEYWPYPSHEEKHSLAALTGKTYGQGIVSPFLSLGLLSPAHRIVADYLINYRIRYWKPTKRPKKTADATDNINNGVVLDK